jgi:integrase
MIGLHRHPQGGLTMRRDEHPTKRITNGRVRWVARYTNRSGKRTVVGTFDREGPCKRRDDDAGMCCAQHRLWWAYENDTPAEATPLTVRGYYEGDWLKRHPRMHRTELNYRNCVQAVLMVRTDGQPFGDLPIARVRARHIDDLVDAMLRGGRAASGARGVLSVLSAMWRDAIRDDVAENNPVQYVSVRDSDPRVARPARSRVVVPWGEMHRFAACAGQYEPMIRTLSDCGLRIGELLALERRHDEGAFLLIDQHAWRGAVSSGMKVGERRRAPVPPGLRALLDSTPTRIDTMVLFPRPDGRVWHASSFYKHVWHPTARRAGLALQPHDFRHSYVSLMRAAGVDPADLAEATGHTVATATAHYTHSTGGAYDLMREAVGA